MTQQLSESLDGLNAVLLALYNDAQNEQPDRFIALAIGRAADWLGVTPSQLKLKRIGVPHAQEHRRAVPGPSSVASVRHLKAVRESHTADWLTVDETGHLTDLTEDHDSLDELRCCADHAEFSLLVTGSGGPRRLDDATDGLRCWLPHFVQAVRLNQTHFLKRQQRGEETVALVDRIGRVWATTGSTRALTDGADHHQQCLTAPVVESLRGDGEWRGARVQYSAQPVGPFLLLHAMPIRALDQLTPREQDIAHRFTQGFSYKEVAMQLSISPATVRNHIARIYSKTDVRNKVALSLLLAG